MKIFGRILAMVIVVGSSMSQALAEDEINSYVSVNAGLDRTLHACNSPLLAGGVGSCGGGGRNNPTALYRLAYGYQFTPAWGIEVSTGDLGYASATGTMAAPAAPAVGPAMYNWSLKATGWVVAGTGTLDMGKRFSLFGKVGLVRAEFKEDFTVFAANGTFPSTAVVNNATTHLMGGAGAQVNFTPTFSLRGQVEYFGAYDVFGANAPKVKLTMASAGLVFKF